MEIIYTKTKIPSDLINGLMEINGRFYGVPGEAIDYFKQLELDAALGRLVLQKMTSGNSVPVERCTVYDHELKGIYGESFKLINGS